MAGDQTMELQLDGLVGPTHHFGGLASGNLASASSAESVSNPRAAARQGIAKMRAVLAEGVPIGLLPPRERPNVGFLRRVGFEGADEDVVRQAAQRAPQVLRASASASAMWTANAATVTASVDAGDGRVHLTPANLVSHLHRALEADETQALLRAAFADESRFAVHDPLPPTSDLSDEGAANHTRLASDRIAPGVSLFVWGRGGDSRDRLRHRFESRQSCTASAAVARQHLLRHAVYAQQHPAAIDAGAFHHDVVGVGDVDVLVMHERALVDPQTTIDQLRTHLPDLRVDLVGDDRLTLDEAVATYLFNSQLLSAGRGRVLVADRRALDHPRAAAVVDEWRARGFVDAVVPVDLDESMRNGGGPACLRLRVPLTRDELEAVHPGFLLDASRLDGLDAWVDRHYRDELSPVDLADPQLLHDVRDALDELTRLLGTGPVYDFQR